MATIVQTVGSNYPTGRDFAALQDWANALPSDAANPAADTYAVDVYPDSEFTGSTTLLTLSGHTYPIIVRAVANAFPRSAHNYNAANGVAITSSVAANSTFNISDTNVTLQGLQIRNTAADINVLTKSGSGFLTVSNCLIKGGFSSSGNVNYRNSTLITTASDVGIYNAAGISVDHCTIVYPSDGSPTVACIYNINSSTFRNCGFFGFTAVDNGGSNTYITCMTNVGTPPSGCTQVTYSNQFENTTTASGDWRPKAGADLIGNGTAIGGITTDITGFTRKTGTAPLGPDIGSYEFAAGGAPWTVPANWMQQFGPILAR